MDSKKLHYEPVIRSPTLADLDARASAIEQMTNLPRRIAGLDELIVTTASALCDEESPEGRAALVDRLTQYSSRRRDATTVCATPSRWPLPVLLDYTRHEYWRGPRDHSVGDIRDGCEVLLKVSAHHPDYERWFSDYRHNIKPLAPAPEDIGSIDDYRIQDLLAPDSYLAEQNSERRHLRPFVRKKSCPTYYSYSRLYFVLLDLDVVDPFDEPLHSRLMKMARSISAFASRPSPLREDQREQR